MTHFSHKSLLFLLALFAASSASPLSYRTYGAGQSLWIEAPEKLLLYRYDTRSLKEIAFSDSLEHDPVFDITDNGDQLWVIAQSGLYQVDKTSATIEKIPGAPPMADGNAVSADMDYVWVAQADNLWKFDILGREWFPFALGSLSPPENRFLGASSDGDEVILLAPSAVLHFSVDEEKWRSYTSPFAFSPASQFYPGAGVLTVADGAAVRRYIVDKLAWDDVALPAPAIDLCVFGEQLHILTAAGSFGYSGRTSVLQRFDIPDVRNPRLLGRQNDTTLVLAGEKALTRYDLTSRTTEAVPYPPRLSGRLPLAIIGGNVLLYADAIAIYSTQTRTWEVHTLSAQDTRRRVFSWDENGQRIRMGRRVESRLRGSISQRGALIDGGYDYSERIESIFDSSLMVMVDTSVIDTERLFYYSPGRPGDDLYGDLTLHTTLPGNRYADLFFRKEASRPTRRGFFYRGAGDDRFESARIGTNDLSASQTVPGIRYEGGNAIVHSRRGLATRDRKIFRAQAGGGLVTSRNRHAVLPYSPFGRYSIDISDSGENLMIVPGSLRIMVDGEQIDTVAYSFVPITGDLTFERRDLLDPTSVIIVSYTVQRVPEGGIDEPELIPGSSFARMEYASATVSPTDWASVQGGYTALSTDSSSLGIATASLPLELRLPRPDLLLKVTPELSVETGSGAKAAAASVQTRLGRWGLGSATSILLNAVMQDDAFESTDRLSRGYGKLRRDIGFQVNHDIRTELPLHYEQADRSAHQGSEQYRQASAGVHFRNLPFLDLIWSQNQIAVDSAASDTTQGFDREKNKVKVRLYEISSQRIERLLRLSRFGYEFAYTRFSGSKELPDSARSGKRLPGTGDILFASTTISPLPSVTVNGQMTFKESRQQDSLFDQNRRLDIIDVESNPTLTIQTIDAPPGIDFSAYYSADYRGEGSVDTTGLGGIDSGLVTIQRKFFVITKPGSWTSHLSWLSPRFGISENRLCRFDSTAPLVSDLLLGRSDSVSSSLTRTIGAHFSPGSDFLLRQENSFTTGDSITNFYTFNDCKWWFGANRLWQARWEFNDITRGAAQRKKIHKMFTFYDATWNAWLRTNEKLGGEYVLLDSAFKNEAGEDTAVAERRFTFGPEVSLSFNVQQRGVVKTFISGHTVKVNWQHSNGSFRPGTAVSYTTFVELIFKPNIGIETNHSVAQTFGTTTYNGDLSVRLLF